MEIQNILILGSGTMGHQIGLLCAAHGYEVVLYDIQAEMMDAARKRVEAGAARMAAKGIIQEQDKTDILNRMAYTTDPHRAAENADLLSESVPEDPLLKGKVLGQFNELCPETTLFTSNTSSLIPSMFAEASGRPDRLCALHFHDVFLSNIVDVMPHPGTSPETLDTVKTFAESIGQIPILLHKEHNGYVFNNMLMVLLESALTLAEKDVASIEDIDRSWMGVMHTDAGPFGTMDAIGLDTVYKITDYWAKVRNDEQAKRNAAFLKEYIEQGHTGRKSGRGFYTYPDPAFREPDWIRSKTSIRPG